MLKSYRWRHTVAPLVFSCASAQSAVAADDAAPPENDEQGVESLNAVTITEQETYYTEDASSATRMDLPVIETPQSLYVINADLIADQQAFRLDQILQNDASVQKSNNFLGAYSSYQVRGFDLSNTSNYLRDGRSNFHLHAPPVEVLERVEVLKGPASVLYGTLAPGGLVNMVPKRPTEERLTALKATFGSYDLQHYHIDHGGPLDSEGKVRYRLNGVYEDSGSFREFADGSQFTTRRKAVSAALDWDATDDTLVRVNVDWLEDDRPQDIGLVNLTGDFSGQSFDTIYNQPWSRYDSDVWNFFAEVDHTFNEHWRVRAGYSFQDYERDRYDNQTRGLPDENGNVNIRARHRINRRDYATTYVDAIAKFDTGPLAHELLIGIDRTDVDVDNNETSRNEVFTTNIFNPEIIPDPQIPTRPEKNLGEEERQGITLHDVISIGEHWRILAGARYDEFEAAQRDPEGVTTFEQKADNVSPRLGVLYLLNPGLSVYGSYSQSFEPNAVVGPAYENAGAELAPTLGEQLEVGVKWEALGGRLLATGAVFTITRKDSPTDDLETNRRVQRGEQQHDGAEFSVTGLVGDNLSITGSATYLSAEFTEDDDENLIGNTPAGVPDWALNVAAEYAFLEGAVSGLSLQGGWFYEGDRPIDDANTFDLEAYNRIDLGLKYLLGGSGARPDMIFRLTAQNVTDEEYFKGSSPLSINPERPREIRASIELSL